MTDELGRRLEQLVDRAADGTPDVEAVVSGGRRHQRRTWIGRGVVAVLVASSITVGVSMMGDLIGGKGDLRITAPGGVPDDRAATFAIRAIAQADMMNPRGSFYGYHSIERGEEGWVVHFASSECIRTETLQTCVPSSGKDKLGRANADTEVVVGVDDDGNLQVASVERSGEPVPDDQRERVEAYTEPPNPVSPHPEFAPLILEQGDPQADGDSLVYQAAGYWAGPIPDHRLTFGCFARAFNEAGDVVYESLAYPYESPPEEARRGGGILSSGFPASTKATRVEMICDEFTGPGWELASTPELRQPEGASHVRVRADLIWKQRALAVVALRCTTTVVDRAGQTLGEITLPMAGPRAGPGDEPPFQEQLDVIVDVSGDSLPTDATFACILPSPPVAEPQDGEEPSEEEEGQGDSAPRPTGEPPNGPRELIDSGTFEGSDWGQLNGKGWWLEAWEVDGYRCWSFTLVERGGTGRSCTSAAAIDESEEYIGSSGSTPGLGYDADHTIIYGELQTEVSYIEIELSSGQTYRIEALVPGPGLGINAHYFVAFVEASEGYSVSAYDADGDLLQKQAYNRNG